MRNFKFFKENNEEISVMEPEEPGYNTIWNLDMDLCLIAVINYKISRNLPLLGNDTDLSEVNFPVNNCCLRINRSNNFSSNNIDMVEIDYQLIELNNGSYNFTYRSRLSELTRRLTYEAV